MASTATRRSIFVVAGIGNGTGTGAATAHAFARAGYLAALIARNPEHLNKTADKIKEAGGEAAAFPVKSYTYDEIHTVFEAIKKHWPDADIRVGLYNTGPGIWSNFLDITPQAVQEMVDTTIVGAFAFARETILAIKDLPHYHAGKRGTLLFTGATASWRGNKTTSAFSASKFAVRSLTQSLNKEFGKQDIHVAHAVIDGPIITDRMKEWRNNDPEWVENEAIRLSPESIAKAYMYLANQDRSAWTWELDLRPAHESW